MNLPFGKFRAYVQKSWGEGHRLLICYDEMRPGNPLGALVRIADGFTWKETFEGAMFDPQEGIGGADDIIQSIMDRGWEAGFRPRGFTDMKNETSALREHLADMKTIAFNQLKINSNARG